jgi:hypothetical protein
MIYRRDVKRAEFLIFAGYMPSLRTVFYFRQNLQLDFEYN